MAYLLLFASAFGAATLLPFYSEITLVALLHKGYNPLWLWLTATCGNSLGAVINWWLGLYINRFQKRSWFPFKDEQLLRSQKWFQRYGVWSLLLAWLPIVGDGLTLIAGMMRVRFPVFFLLTTIGKGLRYAVVLIIFYELVSLTSFF